MSFECNTRVLCIYLCAKPVVSSSLTSTFVRQSADRVVRQSLQDAGEQLAVEDHSASADSLDHDDCDCEPLLKSPAYFGENNIDSQVDSRLQHLREQALAQTI